MEEEADNKIDMEEEDVYEEEDATEVEEEAEEEVLPVLPPKDAIQHVKEMVEPEAEDEEDEEETLLEVAKEVVKEQKTCKPKRIDNEATKALKKSLSHNKTRKYIDNLSTATYSALEKSQNSGLGKQWVDESKLIMRAQTEADRFEDHEQNFSLLSDLPTEIPEDGENMCTGKTWGSY